MASSPASLYCGLKSSALGKPAVLLTMDLLINTDIYIKLSYSITHRCREKCMLNLVMKIIQKTLIVFLRLNLNPI